MQPKRQINVDVDLSRIENEMQIRSVDDLPDPEDGVIDLAEESNTGYHFRDVIATDATIRIGSMTPLFSSTPYNGGILHTGSGVAIESEDEHVYFDGMIISAPGGQAFDISGTQEYSMKIINCQIADVMNMGDFNSIGVVDGMRVPVIDGCNVENFVEGITFTGHSNKIFITSTPFRNCSGNDAAIIFDPGITTQFVDIEKSFFTEFTGDASGFWVQDPDIVEGEAVITRNLAGSSVSTFIEGVDRGDVRWDFRGNSGIQDSAVRGGFFTDEEIEVLIDEQATDKHDAQAYSSITGSAVENDVMERVEVLDVNSTLTYTGIKDVGLTIFTDVTLEGGNDVYAIALFRNGNILNPSIRVEELGPQAGSVSLQAQIDVSPEDEFTARVANLDGTSDADVINMSMIVTE